MLPSKGLEEAADQTGYELMQRLLKRRSRPNGVFCHNDVIAVGAMKATLDAGFRIPEDFAFVGFDNVRFAKYLQIPLTSVDQGTSQLGETAAQLALDLIADKLQKPANILLVPTLVIRQSSTGQSADAAAIPSHVHTKTERPTVKYRSTETHKKAVIKR